MEPLKKIGHDVENVPRLSLTTSHTANHQNLTEIPLLGRCLSQVLVLLLRDEKGTSGCPWDNPEMVPDTNRGFLLVLHSGSPVCQITC